jgi:hypothetical protein
VINLTKKDELMCEKVILVLESEEIQNQVIREFRENMDNRKKHLQLIEMLGTDKVGDITIDKAPEPEEIIWGNIYLPR